MPTRIVAGRYKRKVLSVPRGKKTRPTLARLRESLFAYLGGDLNGMVICDLFAGSGSLGLEAMSRGADYAVFVERDCEALRCLSDNIENFDLVRRTEVVNEDVFSFLGTSKSGGRSFDIVFADPDYASDDARRLLSWFDREYTDSLILCIEHRSKDLGVPEMKRAEHMRTLKAGDKRISIYRFGGDS